MSKALIGTNDKDNYLVSPLSILFPVALTAYGAKGETRQELVKYLGIADKELDLYALKLYALFDGKSYISIANMAIVNDTFEMNPEYRSHVKKFGLIENASFADKDMIVEKVNTFVSDTTKGNIPTIIGSDDLTDDTQVILTNALHIKLEWLNEFDDEPLPGKFYDTLNIDTDTDGDCNVDSDVKFVKFLHDDQTTFYFEDDKVQIVSLYMENMDKFVMILPKKDHENYVFSEEFTYDLSKCTKEYTRLRFPVFKMETSMSLVESMKKSGVNLVFDSACSDLTGIFTPVCGDEVLYVSDILHKATFDINQKGIEGAAATVALMMLEGYYANNSMGPSKLFNADRPFRYQLLDHTTNSVMFDGIFHGATTKYHATQEECKWTRDYDEAQVLKYMTDHNARVAQYSGGNDHSW